MSAARQHVACSCDAAAAHIIGRRRTADGIGIALWSDATITGTFGHAIKGLPLRAPTSDVAARRTAAWLFAGEVALYDLDECATLYRAALAVARRAGDPGDVRSEVERLLEPRLVFAWETTASDRDGRWTEQTARLDRMRWPGVVVGRTRAGYEVFYERRCTRLTQRADETRVIVDVIHETSGFRCGDARTLTKFLLSINVLSSKGGEA